MEIVSGVVFATVAAVVVVMGLVVGSISVVVEVVAVVVRAVVVVDSVVVIATVKVTVGVTFVTALLVGTDVAVVTVVVGMAMVVVVVVISSVVVMGVVAVEMVVGLAVTFTGLAGSIVTLTTAKKHTASLKHNHFQSVAWSIIVRSHSLTFAVVTLPINTWCTSTFLVSWLVIANRRKLLIWKNQTFRVCDAFNAV